MDKAVRLRLLTNALLIWGALFFLSGCAYKDEPVPVVVDDYPLNRTVVSPRTPPKVHKSTNEGVPADWIPPSRLERKRRWTAIVIHHSGTESGNAALFDKWHRENRNWEGVGYDFVIGNGTDSGNGEVEVTFRWRQQKTGAHCKTPNNWANEEGIGICLVGNFDGGVPTRLQLQALVRLVRFLQNRYGISTSRIWGHKDTPGAKITDCPGNSFSVARLKSML